MTTKEVIRRYNNGERDFRRLDLRGQSFKGQNLSGADFSEADIRSTNFAKAKLMGARFLRVKAGLAPQQAIVILIILQALSLLAVSLPIIVGILVSYIIEYRNYYNLIVGLVSLTLQLIFCVFTVRNGLIAGNIVMGTAFIVIIIPIIGRIFGIVNTTFAVAVAGVTAASLVGSIGALFVATIVASSLAIGKKNIIFLASIASVLSIIAIANLNVVVSEAVSQAVAGVKTVTGTVSLGIAGLVSLILIIFGSYIGYLSIKENIKYTPIRNIAIRIAAIFGTNFSNGANLSNADFTESISLQNTNFTNAILTRAIWIRAKKINLAQTDGTYLQNVQLREWLIFGSEGEEKSKNFDNQDLRGVNLKGVDLTNASFIDANLINANLDNTTLLNAKFKRTKLNQASLRHASLKLLIP